MKKSNFGWMQDFYQGLSQKIAHLDLKILSYLQKNLSVILLLVVIALAAYGFELFNFTLTIDEEYASLFTGLEDWKLSIGRWGNYLLGALIPMAIIPFVPLSIALIFQTIAILLILDTFQICDKKDQLIVGAVGLSYSGMAFIYNFTHETYKIGFGLFCIALSLYVYTREIKGRYFLALIPAVFAISIYQPFLPALVTVYLLYVIYTWNKSNVMRLKEIGKIIIFTVLSFVIYYLISKLFVALFGVTEYGYLTKAFDFDFVGNNPGLLIKNFLWQIFNVYSGGEAIYGLEIRSMAIILILLGLGIVHKILWSKTRTLEKIANLLVIGLFIVIPFLAGILTNGYVPLRSMAVSMPFILMGWMMLGLINKPAVYKSLITFFSILCVFQFVLSSNHLFASSHMAFLEDRVLATQLISRIEEAKNDANSSDVQYFEMIGFIDRPATPLISRIETIGASFFGWDAGNPKRVTVFLGTLGYHGLKALPDERRGDFIDVSTTMPMWPDAGSVVVYNDTVIVKFSDYSAPQKLAICQYIESSEQMIVKDFCP